MTVATAPTVDLTGQLHAAESDIEILTESLASAQLALEDRGWTLLTAGAKIEFTREGLKDAAAVARTMAVTHPLIRRGLAVRTSYVWGQGVTISARDTGGGQDLNALVQEFLDDPGNKAAFTSGQAHEENERTLGTDGNFFLACFGNPRTGRVQVRSLPPSQVAEIITNPEDADEPWFYRRQWTTTVVHAATGQDGRRSTGTTSAVRTAFYPALGFRPRQRPKLIDGHDVMWDAPVRHVSVNRLDDWTFGIGDVYTALTWARMYGEFLTDWARLMKALSKLAWQAHVKGGARAGQVRDRLAAGGLDGPAGGTAVATDNVRFEAVSKSGATLDSQSGKPLAAMVAAALDIPVTMLLGDPGVTGARATAETLDAPMRLAMEMRQSLWADVIRDVLGHVIDQAVKAPAGPLQGTVRLDPDTGREIITLAGDQPRDVDVDWPDLDDIDMAVMVDAVVKADDTGKLPPLEVARMLLQALKHPDVDAVLDLVTDDDGQFVPPDVSAGGAAADAFRRGEDPASVL